jgi:tight adherence protein C
MSPAWLGASLGLLLGLGLITVLGAMPLLRRTDLDSRLEPYLRDTARPSRLLAEPQRSPIPVIFRLAAPAVRDAARAVERVLGGAASVRRRLQRAGRPADVDAFRAQQVLWGIAGLAVGGALAGALHVVRSSPPAALAVLVLVLGAAGVAGRDWWLSREVSSRESRMLAELPTIAEMLALAVAAGEGPVPALERVARLSNGELTVELERALADARAGAPVPVALQGLADRTGLVPLARFVDGVVVAVERGTPLADVLRAQAVDVREAGQRALMDTAGKKEIAMMLPVVFLVLPVTVLFAVYPGFAFLRLGL